MNAPSRSAAAFQASYADWKLIRSRKVIQVVLEIPLEQADQAYAVLGGMPNPGAEIWCGVARLAGKAEQEKAKPRKPVAPERRLTQQAAIACSKPAFWRFLGEIDGSLASRNAEDAASAVRFACGVDSRSEIIVGTPAGDKWEKLYGQFLVWEQAL